MPTVISDREPIRSASLPIGSDQDDEDRHRQERGTGLDRRVVEHVLHVERDEEETPNIASATSSSTTFAPT